ncbi:MAG: DUF3467 domain-containing protein [Anaerolineales bacterium]|jgi:hypothetical protein
MNEPSAPPSGKLPWPLELPAGLEPSYANLALITHSAMEVVIDFARVLPGLPKGRVCSRVVMAPLSAKLLLRALNENLSKYEAQFGEIHVPEGSSLADQLFGRPAGEPPATPRPPGDPTT